MSRYEWERAEILLPAAAVPVVKEAVRNAHNKVADLMYEEGKKFWANWAKRTRSTKLYKERLEAWHESKARRGANWTDYSDVPEWVHDLRWVLERLAEAPRQITWADLDKAQWGKATNRTTKFGDSSEWDLVFKDRTVVWHVGENNHACDRAQEHPIAKAFFAALDKVTWTRGTGGKLVGNDEYNRDADYEGGGGNIFKQGWGPLGEPDYFAWLKPAELKAARAARKQSAVARQRPSVWPHVQRTWY